MYTSSAQKCFLWHLNTPQWSLKIIKAILKANWTINLFFPVCHPVRNSYRRSNLFLPNETVIGSPLFVILYESSGRLHVIFYNTQDVIARFWIELYYEFTVPNLKSQAETRELLFFLFLSIIGWTAIRIIRCYTEILTMNKNIKSTAEELYSVLHIQ